jgi:hypothetical protein
VHVNAIGAAVDLRGAKFNEVKEFFFDAGRFQVSFEREHGVQGVWRIFVVGDAGFHGRCRPFVAVRWAAQVYFLIDEIKTQRSWIGGKGKTADKPAATKGRTEAGLNPRSTNSENSKAPV